MPRSKKFSVTREVFKIGRAANNLRKALNPHTELENQSKSFAVRTGSSPRVEGRSRTETVQENAEYEKRLLRRLGRSIDKHFYNNLVGVSYKNHDGTSRKEAIQKLEEHQELDFHQEFWNEFDPNAILVCTSNGGGLGYLNKRLAGEVSRSKKAGVRWSCYVRRVLHASGTKNWGVTVCMVKHNKSSEKTDSKPGMSGPEFLAKYDPDYIPIIRTANPQSTNIGLGVLFVVALLIFLAVIVYSC